MITCIDQMVSMHCHTQVLTTPSFTWEPPMVVKCSSTTKHARPVHNEFDLLIDLPPYLYNRHMCGVYVCYVQLLQPKVNHSLYQILFSM